MKKLIYRIKLWFNPKEVVLLQMLLDEIGKNRDGNGLMLYGGLCNYINTIERATGANDARDLQNILDMHKPNDKYFFPYWFPIFEYEPRREFLLNLIEKYKQKV